ncbi:MAG: hypothetical protein MJK18_11215 [Bdellovibrionales bacterium]|nr:hypothetical protein [Bdellovibrionales bacterium]
MVLTVIMMSLACTEAMATIAFRGKDFCPTKANRTAFDNQGVELNINREFVKKGREGFNDKTVTQMVPLRMRPTSNGDQVKDQIMRKTARSITDSPMVKDNFITRRLKSLQKQFSMDLSLKPKAQPKPQAKKQEAPKKPKQRSVADLVKVNKTNHDFKMNVNPMKGKARVRYTGFVQSQVQYNHREASVDVSLEEQLSENSRIAFSHRSNPQGSQQMLNYQIRW